MRYVHQTAPQTARHTVSCKYVGHESIIFVERDISAVRIRRMSCAER